MGFFKNKKDKQSKLTAESQKKKSEQAFYNDENMIQPYIQNHARIIDDSLRIIQETTSPDVFFSRYDLIIKHINMSIDLLSKANGKYQDVIDSGYNTLTAISNSKQAYITEFIKRYWGQTHQKILTLKTEKAKENYKQKFLNSLKPYECEMSEQNKAILQKISNL